MDSGSGAGIYLEKPPMELNYSLADYTTVNLCNLNVHTDTQKKRNLERNNKYMHGLLSSLGRLSILLFHINNDHSITE